MHSRDYLFSSASWFDVEANQLLAMKQEIASISADRLLNTSVEDLARYCEDKYRIDVPILQKDNATAEQNEAQIDVRYDQMRLIADTSRPHYVTGTEVVVEVPFTGDGEVFKIRPTTFTMNPPRAVVHDNLLVIRVSGTNLQADAVRQGVEKTLSEIEGYLTTLRTNTAGLNQKLLPQARSAIETRRQKLLADRSLVGSLGFRMKERAHSEQTYAAMEVKRKLVPTLPRASSAPFKPEPVLLAEDYEHILGILESMAHVMERSPSAFGTMDEESLRTHFLVQLNGHYEGQATGETFNYEGKTDILVRSEGRNIFIGECKFWNGPKKLTETIDQLLSYSAWRDTKTAVLIFNRKRDFSRVLDAIPGTVRAHPNYKRDITGSSETRFRFSFAHRDDPNRELLLTVLAFDIPAAREA